MTFFLNFGPLSYHLCEIGDAMHFKYSILINLDEEYEHMHDTLFVKGCSEVTHCRLVDRMFIRPVNKPVPVISRCYVTELMEEENHEAVRQCSFVCKLAVNMVYMCACDCLLWPGHGILSR